MKETSGRASIDERINTTGPLGAKHLLLQAGQAVADLGSLFEFEIAGVIDHLLLEQTDLARQGLLGQGQDVRP